MGEFVNIRGWIECDPPQLKLLREFVAEHEDPTGLYQQGWTFPPGSNGHIYAFYGASIRTRHLDWFLEQLRCIAAIDASGHDDERVRGLLVASHEAEGMYQWHIHDGQVFVTAADPRHAFLDKHL